MYRYAQKITLGKTLGFEDLNPNGFLYSADTMRPCLLYRAHNAPYITAKRPRSKGRAYV